MYKILTILIITLSHTVLGQSPKVLLSINPSRADVGETFTITVKSDIQGDLEVDNKPSSFVPGYDVMNGMKQDINSTTGKVTTYYYLSQTGSIRKSGKYTIGPAFIKQGNKVYRSNTVDITIGDKIKMIDSEAKSKQIKERAFGIIQTNKKTFYEGEPVFMVAKIYSHFEPTHLSNYRSYSIDGIIKKQSVNNSQHITIKRENLNQFNLYAFEYDKNIVFPPGIGEFKVAGYTLNLHRGPEDYHIISNQTVFEVLPLPGSPPEDFIGGVGEFQMIRSIDARTMTQGDVFKMEILVKGVGNLQNITPPKPVLPKGLSVYGDPIIVDNYSYNSHGTEGSISYEYNIQVNSFGEIKIPATTISYFDPTNKKYYTLSSPIENIHVDKDESYFTQESQQTQKLKSNTIEELPYATILSKLKVIEKETEVFGSPLFFVGIFSSFFIAFIFLLIRRKRGAITDQKAFNDNAKNNALNSSLNSIELAINKKDDEAFFIGIENTLIKAFKIKFDFKGEHILNKSEIYDHLSDLNKIDLLDSIKHLFITADQFRFGITSSTESKQTLYDQLNDILIKMKE